MLHWLFCCTHIHLYFCFKNVVDRRSIVLLVMRSNLDPCKLFRNLSKVLLRFLLDFILLK